LFPAPSLYEDTTPFDDDDDLQLLSHQAAIAGHANSPPAAATSIPHDTTSSSRRTPPTTAGRRSSKSFFGSLKESIHNVLNKAPAASGTMGPGGERIIHINNTELNDQQRFLNNKVFTAKYTAFTFLPKFLYEEFSKYANIFFLFVSGIQVKAKVNNTIDDD
jgi:phospholipid-transporting ATPase